MNALASRAIAFLCTMAAQATGQLPTLVRTADIGCSDCGGPGQFAVIHDVAVNDSGDILVVSADAPTLRLFDRSGRSLWSTGRDGTGPGEFRLAIRAALGPGVIQVVDMTQRRITRLDRAGRYVSSAAVNGFPAAVGARGHSGELVVLLDDFRGTFLLERWMPGDSGARIGPVPASPGRRPGVLTIPSLAVAPSGEVAVARDPDEYRIVLLSATGAPLGEIVRDIPRVRRTAEEMAAIERRRAAASARLGRERGMRGGSAPVLPIRAPSDELKPHLAIDGLRYDDSGRLWAKTLRGGATSTVFDLFAPGGRYLGPVTIPVLVGAFTLGGRWLVADVEADDGSPRVVVWEVR